MSAKLEDLGMTKGCLEKITQVMTSLERSTKLTDREREVFECLGRCLTTEETSAMLEISPKTLDIHRTAIRKKLGTNSQGVVRAFAVWKLVIEPRLK